MPDAVPTWLLSAYSMTTAKSCSKARPDGCSVSLTGAVSGWPMWPDVDAVSGWPAWPDGCSVWLAGSIRRVRCLAGRRDLTGALCAVCSVWLVGVTWRVRRLVGMSGRPVYWADLSPPTGYEISTGLCVSWQRWRVAAAAAAAGHDRQTRMRESSSGLAGSAEAAACSAVRCWSDWLPLESRWRRRSSLRPDQMAQPAGTADEEATERDGICLRRDDCLDATLQTC